MRRFLLTTGLVCSVMAVPMLMGGANSYAELPVDIEEPLTDSTEEPVEIENLMDYEVEDRKKVEEDTLPIDIRMDAIKEAAISFGARWIGEKNVSNS